MENKFFPVNLKVEGQKILVIGAGKIAARKAESLLSHAAKLQVISKKIEQEIFWTWQKEGKIELEERELKREDFPSLLEDSFLVIAATDDLCLNADIARYCMEHQILVNNISSKEEMNLRFMSLYENEDFQIAISAKGNPSKAKALKEKLISFFQKED